MALGLSYRCACGKQYKIYMPKGKLFSSVVTRFVDWRAVDAREEAEGDVDRVRRLATLTRCEFVDGRVTERLICTDCAAEIDLTRHFRSALTRA